MNHLAFEGVTLALSLVLLWYLYARDQFPEPRTLRVKTFLLGLFCCFVSMFVRLYFEEPLKALDMGSWSIAWRRALLALAIPQELLKFLVVYGYARRKPAFNEPLDGAIYGATAALGFAALENMSHVGELGMEIALLRSLLAVPGQAACGVVMGSYVGRAHFTRSPRKRLGLLALALGGPILLNALFNAPLLTHQFPLAWLAVLVNVLAVSWAWRLFKALREEQDRLFHVLESRARALAAGDVGGPISAVAPEIEWAVVPRQPPLERTWWAWTKLALGGLGLCFCALLWLTTFSITPTPGDTPAGKAGTLSAAVCVVLFVDIPLTWLFIQLFRSGLRGPFVSSPVS